MTRGELGKLMGTTDCLLGCEGEPDDLHHIKKCPRYRVQWNENTDAGPEELLGYLKNIETQRVQERGLALAGFWI